MVPAAYAQYRKVNTQTASPGELLLQLYRAAIKNCGQACDAIARHDPAQAHHHIVRVQDIIAELRRTLDLERGGEVAVELDRLYVYMLQRLLKANVDKDAAPVDEVAGYLRQLAGAWEVAVRQTAQQTVKAAAAPAFVGAA